jgi:hypothetical protein
MELDDLRRQWQQPTADTASVSSAELNEMLAAKSDGLIEKMRRNTWLEALFTVAMVVGTLFYMWAKRSDVIYLLLGGTLLLLSAVLLVHYYRQLQLLQRMTRTDAQVRTHLGTLGAGLRRLLRFYYRLTLAVLPYMLIMLLGFQVSKELAHPGGFHWKFIGLLAAAYLVLGVVVQVAVVYATRWYLQRLYGQHLDRLEASLRELAEPEPAPAS